MLWRAAQACIAHAHAAWVASQEVHMKMLHAGQSALAGRPVSPQCMCGEWPVCGRDTLTKRVRDSPVLTPVLVQRTPALVLCTSTSGARGHAPMAKWLPPRNGRVGDPSQARARHRFWQRNQILESQAYQFSTQPACPLQNSPKRSCEAYISDCHLPTRPTSDSQTGKGGETNCSTGRKQAAPTLFVVTCHHT